MRARRWLPMAPSSHTADDVLANGRYGAMQYMRKGSKLADTNAGETVAVEFAVFPYARGMRPPGNWLSYLMADRCRRNPSVAGGSPHVNSLVWEGCPFRDESILPWR